MNNSSYGRSALFAVSLTQAGLFFVSWFLSLITNALFNVGAFFYYYLMFSVGLIFVGLNVLSRVEFPDKAFRIMGKVSVICIFAISTVSNIISTSAFGSWNLYMFVNIFMWALVYGGTLAAYFVFDAKFRLTNLDLPAASAVKKPWNEGKVATFYIAVFTTAVELFVGYIVKAVGAAPEVDVYAIISCIGGFLLVGLNVWALFVFPEKVCRNIGLVSVICSLLVYCLLFIIQLIGLIMQDAFDVYPSGYIIYMILHTLCYGGLPFIYYLVLNAKFPVVKESAPLSEGEQINN